MNLDLSKEYVEINLKYTQKAYEILAILLHMFKNGYYLDQSTENQLQNKLYLSFTKIKYDNIRATYSSFTSEITNNNHYVFQISNILKNIQNNILIRMVMKYPIGYSRDSITIKTDIDTKEITYIEKNHKSEYSIENDKHNIKKIDNVLNKHVKKLKFFEENIKDIFNFINDIVIYNATIININNIIFNISMVYQFKKYMNSIKTYNSSYKEIDNFIDCLSNNMVEHVTYRLGILTFIKKSNNIITIIIVNKHIYVNIYLNRLNDELLGLILKILNVDGGVDMLKTIIYKNRILTE